MSMSSFHSLPALSEDGVLADVAEAQTPLLAALLLVAGVAKLRSLANSRGGVSGGVAALVPPHHRRTVSAGLALVETALGLALIVTEALLVRVAVAVLFVTATGVVGYLWRRRPEAGCGCFGEVSSGPVSGKTVVRTAVIALAGLVALNGRASAVTILAGPSAVHVVTLLLEVGGLAALSPALLTALRRSRGERAMPCAYRWVPVADTARRLHASAEWRRYRGIVSSTEPLDVWRDLCWQIFAYSGRYRGTHVHVVFAVHLNGRRPDVRVAIVDAERDEVLAGPGVTAETAGGHGPDVGSSPGTLSL